MDDAFAFFALRFFFGKDPTLVVRFAMAGLDRKNLLRSAACFIAGCYEVHEVLIVDVRTNLLEHFRCDDVITSALGGLLEAGNRGAGNVLHIDGPIERSLNGDDAAPALSAIPMGIVGKPAINMQRL